MPAPGVVGATCASSCACTSYRRCIFTGGVNTSAGARRGGFGVLGITAARCAGLAAAQGKPREPELGPVEQTRVFSRARLPDTVYHRL